MDVVVRIVDVVVCRLSDASGSMNFDLVAEGEISKDMLDTNVSIAYLMNTVCQKKHELLMKSDTVS